MRLAYLIRWIFPPLILSAWVPLLIAGAQVESNARPKVGPETDASSILAAKRDLEAIKAIKDAQLAPALTGPSQRLAVPELRTESVAVPPPALRAVKPDANAKNWLIDGMAQTERVRRDARDRQRSTDANRGSSRISADRDLGGRGTAFGSNPSVDQNAIDPLDPLSQLDSRGPALAERNAGSAGRAADESKTPGAFNPLTHFLGDWMTPQDYALLRPGLETASPSGGIRPGDARFPLPGATDFALESSLKREIPGGFAAATPMPSEQPARSNPFLESLNPIEFTPPARVAPPQGLPSVGFLPNSDAKAGPAPASAAVMAPARPNARDLPKSGQDEKYFKQLNRF